MLNLYLPLSFPTSIFVIDIISSNVHTDVKCCNARLIATKKNIDQYLKINNKMKYIDF